MNIHINLTWNIYLTEYHNNIRLFIDIMNYFATWKQFRWTISKTLIDLNSVNFFIVADFIASASALIVVHKISFDVNCRPLALAYVK